MLRNKWCASLRGAPVGLPKIWCGYLKEASLGFSFTATSNLFAVHNGCFLLFLFSENFALWTTVGAAGGLGGFLLQKLQRALAGADDSGGKCRLLGLPQEFWFRIQSP
jgi:hypothetical protein